MNYSRKAGFMWGFSFGFCIACGLFVNPYMFLLAVLPIGGNVLFRDVT